MSSAILDAANYGAERAATLQRSGYPVAAEAAWRDWLLANPDDVWALSSLGGLLNELCRFDEAEQLLLDVIDRDPACWAAWSNLGNTLVERQRLDDAIAAFSNALRLNPGHAPTLSNIGVALTARGSPHHALMFLDIAAELQPDNAETRCNRALALLAKGDWIAGFEEYEWRWRTRAKPPHPYLVPLWDGAAFPGRTLLLHDEGGFGDTLQFIRYAALAKARGGRVLLRARAPLVSLLARLPALDQVIVEGEALPPFDLHCPMFSLPRLFRTTPESVPFSAGYLRPDPAERARLQAQFAAGPGGYAAPRIGLVWAGGPHPYARESALADRRRSISLDQLAPLAAALPGATFHSLQKGDAAEEALWPPPDMCLVDHDENIESFDDTAALIAQLDLVVSVDTSTAHLAAALGCPVWLLSRHDQCWRWLTSRSDTPWYDSMRLYQQPAPFDWTTPIARLCTDLANLRVNRR